MGKNVKIIGTSHISPESVEKIREVIRREKPDCVAVELDPRRLELLLKGERDVSFSTAKEFGFKTYLFAKLASVIQKNLGKKTGILPGDEMLSAVNEAKKLGIDVALIDRDIRLTLEKLKTLSFREKIGLIKSMLFSVVSGDFEIDKVPDKKLVQRALNELKETSPKLFSILVTERDEHMGIALNQLKNHYENIVAVVGAGHKEGVKNILDELDAKDQDKLSYIG